MSDEHHRRASKGRGIDATPAEDTKSNNPPLYWSVLHHKNLHEGAQSAEKNTGSPAKQMGVPHTEEHDVDVLKSHERLPDEDIPLVIHDRQPLISEVSSRSALSGYGSTTPPISSPFTSQRPIDDHHARKESKWASVRKMVHEKELMIRHIPPAEKNGTAGKRLWSDLSGFSYELTLRECLYLFLALLAVGAVAYSFIFEQWTVIDSLYFTCVMLTTVGYGDETPSTAAGKLFASIFSLGGIVLLGLALGVFGSQLVEAEIKYTQNISSLTSKALEGTFLQRTRHRRTEKETSIRADLEATDGSLSRSCSESSLESVQSIGSTQSSVYDPEASLSRSISSKSARHLKEEEKKCPGLLVIRRHLPGFAPLIIGGLAIAYLESWRWYDTIYYCIVTATTVGFGDLAPKGQCTKALAIVFIPIAVASLGHILGNLASFIVEQRRAAYTKRLWSTELTLEDLDILDEAHDGGVSELEYIKFMLVAMKKIDGELWNDLRKQFKELDCTQSGSITKNDLVLLASRRVKKITHKLQLAEYKNRLTQQSTKSSALESSLQKIIRRANRDRRKHRH